MSLKSESSGYSDFIQTRQIGGAGIYSSLIFLSNGKVLESSVVLFFRFFGLFLKGPGFYNLIRLRNNIQFLRHSLHLPIVKLLLQSTEIII